MTVPTPNSAALDASPGTEPAALTANTSDTTAARAAANQASGKLATQAGRTATASLAAPATSRLPAAAAAAAPGPGFGAGPSEDDPRPASPENGDPAPRGRPPRLRIGWHTMRLRAESTGSGRPAPRGATLPSASEAALRLPPLHSGLILGRDDAGRAVAVPMFTAEPARVIMVGSHRLAQIILLRVLALGAAAVITAADPPAWQGFGRAATGEADRVVVLPEGRPVTAFGTADQPALIVDDLGLISTPFSPSQPRGPWQTRLTILRTLTKSAGALADECRFLLVESPDRDDSLLLIQDGASRRVHLGTTSVEQRAFGGTPLTAPAGTTPAVPAVRRPGG